MGILFAQSSLSLPQVEQMELKGRTYLNVPGYDSQEKFEFGTITSFAYQIENSGIIHILNVGLYIELDMT